MGFSFCRLGHAPGVRLGITGGLEGGQFFFSEIEPNFVCELHERHVQRHNIFGPCPLGAWGGDKRSNIIKCQ